MNHKIKILLMSFLFLGTLAAEAASPKEWTFLLFLNGNNNLDSYGSMNLNQMEEVGSTDQVNLVVQWASMSAKSVKRLLIKKDKDPKKVTSPVIQDIGESDMGDFNNLTNFIKWGHQNFPAKKYFVAVWNHGSGWHVLNKNGLSVRDISYDDKSGNHITTEQLGQSMREASQAIGQKIELYGSDACLMAMAEVAGEMKTAVNYFVGSQDLEPGEGWAYNKFLSRLVAKPTMDGGELADALAQEYYKAYTGGIYGHQEVTMSAYNLMAMTDFENSIKNLVSDINSLSPDQLEIAQTAAGEALNFYYSDYKDFFDFLKNSETKGLPLRLKAVSMAAGRFVISNYVTTSWAKASGLSLWIPANKYEFDDYKDRYKELYFNKSTGWVDAASLLFKQ